MIAIAIACSCGRNPSPPPPPPTVIDPAAVPMLDRWADAVGGRDRLAALTNVHEIGLVDHVGFPQGRYELWWTTAGQRVYHDVTAGFDVTAVFDGTRGWVRDGAGNVRELHGDELVFERTFSFWTSFSALLPYRLPGEVRPSPQGVLLLPKDGNATRVELDDTTSRPRRYVVSDGDVMITDTVDDWRAVDGVWFAFHSTRSTADVPSSAWHAQTIDHAPPPPFVAPIARPVPPVAVPVRVPIEVTENGVLVPVRVDDGPPRPFLLDTAAPYSSLRRDLAGGQRTTLHIGDLEVADIPLDTHRVDDHLIKTFGPVDGILGYDVLAKYVVEIDVTAQTLRFVDRDAYQHAPGGTEIPISLDYDMPTLSVALVLPNRPPIDVRVRLDTTCDCIARFGSAITVQKRLLDGLDGTPMTYTRGLSAVTAKAPGLRIGAVELTNPTLWFVLGKDEHDPATVGTLGLRALRGYRLVLDIAHQRMWLDTSTSAAVVFRHVD